MMPHGGVLTDVASIAETFPSRLPIVLLLAASVIALLALAFVVRYAAVDGENSLLTGPPVVVILPPEFLGAEVGSAFPKRFLDEIEQGLSAFDHMTVRSANSNADPSDYAVSTRFLETTPGRFEINLRLLRGPSGDVVLSRRYLDVDTGDPQAVNGLVRSSVITIGDVGGGAVFTDVRARLAAKHAPLAGFTCIMAGIEFVRERQEERRAATRGCLETELRNDPDNVRALTSLTTILVIDYLNNSPQNRGEADLRRALQLAQRARDLAPQRAETVTAIFFTRFYSKDFDEAFQAAREAINLNPNSSLLMARIARAYISRERYEEAHAVMAPFETANVAQPASLLAPLAIEAIMKGDLTKSLTYTLKSAISGTPLGLVARIVACEETGNQPCVAEAQIELRNSFPGFAKDVPAALQRHLYDESIQARLLKGLADTGWAATSADTQASHGISIKR